MLNLKMIMREARHRHAASRLSSDDKPEALVEGKAVVFVGFALFLVGALHAGEPEFLEFFCGWMDQHDGGSPVVQ